MADGREDSPSPVAKGRTVAFGNSECLGSPAIAETAAASADDPLIGRILRDTYRIVTQLDEGGMGKLYRAEHLRLRRPVAVKFMARTLVTNPEALARFRREAEIISQLEHPHIVHILDFDATVEGEPYIVMELLSGMTLAERMSDAQRVPLQEAVEIALQISSGLMLAHASGIVHRDLKPDNVFLLSMTDKQVFVKLLDFGISMAGAAATRLTGKFDVLGTPDYMAPEQALDSSKIDHRADQWSLACLVYEMLSGRPPFAGDSVVELLRNVVNGSPLPLTTYVPDIPTGVEAVVLRGLSKDPGQRYSCIAELAEQLATAASMHGASDSDSTISASSSTKPTRQNRPTLVEGKGRAKLDSASTEGAPVGGDSGPSVRPLWGTAEPSQSLRPAPRKAAIENRAGSNGAPSPVTPERSVPPNLRSTQPDGSNRGRIRCYSNAPHAPELRSNAPHEEAPGSPDPASVQALCDQLSRAIAFADESKSLEIARTIIKKARAINSADAWRAVGATTDQLIPILIKALGRPGRALRLKSAAPSAKDASLTPQHMFLFSRIVDRMTIDELLDMTPLSTLDTLSMVLDFQEGGYLVID